MLPISTPLWYMDRGILLPPASHLPGYCPSSLPPALALPVGPQAGMILVTFLLILVDSVHVRVHYYIHGFS